MSPLLTLMRVSQKQARPDGAEPPAYESANETIRPWNLRPGHAVRLVEGLGDLENREEGDDQPKASADALRRLEEAPSKNAQPSRQ